jgi:hypothetical protein
LGIFSLDSDYTCWIKIISTLGELYFEDAFVPSLNKNLGILWLCGGKDLFQQAAVGSNIAGICRVDVGVIFWSRIGMYKGADQLSEVVI